MIFKDNLAVLDTRIATEFQHQHLVNSVNIPWQLLNVRLNELPARGTELNIVCSGESDAKKITHFLTEKNYIVKQIVFAKELEKFLAKHSKYRETGRQKTTLWIPSMLILDFIKHCSLVPNLSSVLDIGCGGGRDAVFLSKQGFNVTAIEKNKQVISRAQFLADNTQQKIKWLTCNVSHPDCLPDKQFNVIVIIRYLNRDLITWIKNHTPLGGFLVFQAFSEGVQAFGSPKNPNFIVQEHEFAKTFGKSQGFEIIIDKIETLKDGRPIASFIAKRVEEKQQ